MSARKTIQINPNFLKIGAGRSRTRKRRDHKKDLRASIKPNDIKKKLMSKIKDYQDKSKEITTVNTTEKFTKDFNDQLGYLEKIISAKKDKRKRRRTKRKKVAESPPIGISNPAPSITPSPPHIKINTLSQPATKPALVAPDSSTHIPEIAPRVTYSSLPNKYPEPIYGCLKGGSKPTYSQARKTLKKRDYVAPKDKIAFAPMPQLPSNIQDRKDKLQLLKDKLSIPKPTPIKRFEKRKKTVKIYQLGKDKKARAVGVLIKSGKTRKLVKKEQDVLRSRCLSEVKEYLRKHNLIKAGTTAPEDILRKLYEDSFLAGNIFNKNPDNLLHNYLSKELDNGIK